MITGSSRLDIRIENSILGTEVIYQFSTKSIGGGHIIGTWPWG
jgi:hypothetical protein